MNEESFDQVLELEVPNKEVFDQILFCRVIKNEVFKPETRKIIFEQSDSKVFKP